MLASSILTGCGTVHGFSKAGITRIYEAQELKKTAELELLPVPSAEGRVTLKLVIENPEKKPITSVQSWLSYNPDVLSGAALRTEESPFHIVAPYDNGFDQDAGLVMIGRSTETPVDDEEILVAEIEFEKTADGTAMIEAYDYTSDLTGHSSVNMVIDETPYNILLKPDVPLFSTQ